MKKQEIILIVIGIILLGLLYLSQRARLQAYNDCYMAKYQDWSTDCELGGY